jgi:hypothetical protein
MRILPIITLNKIKKVLTKTKELVKPSEYKLINFQLVNSYQISYPLYNLPPTDIIDVLFQSSGADGRNGLGGGGGAFCHVRIRNPHLYSRVYYYQFYDDFRITKMDGSYVRFSDFRLFSNFFRGAYIAFLNISETDFLTNFPYIELKNVVKGGDGSSNNGESVSTTIELLDRTIYIFSKGGANGGGAAVLGEGDGGLYGGGGSGYGKGAPGCLIIYHYRKIGG